MPFNRRWLIANPHLRERIQDGLNFGTLRQAIGPLKALPGEKVEAVIDEAIAAQAQDVRREAIVEAIREAAGRDSTETEWQVTAKLKASDASLTLQVYARDPEGARRAFERAAGITGTLDGIVSIERYTRTERV